jgi:hypothetical protein
LLYFPLTSKYENGLKIYYLVIIYGKKNKLFINA